MISIYIYMTAYVAFSLKFLFCKHYQRIIAFSCFSSLDFDKWNLTDAEVELVQLFRGCFE